MKNIVVVCVVFFLVQGCTRGQTAGPAGNQGVELTGEWAVEWEDKKREYKETIYLWITQHEDGFTGSALDPNLIPATVTGRLASGEVTFEVGPKSGRGFRGPVPPVSTFKGKITGTNSMEGRYQVRGQRGPWRATRTAAGTNRTVFVSSQTKLSLALTSDEYDLLFSLQPPLSTRDLETKEARRVGNHFAVEDTIGELGGWIYHYRILGDFIRIDPAGSIKERRLQQKILSFLNQHGYPWKSIPP